MSGGISTSPSSSSVYYCIPSKTQIITRRSCSLSWSTVHTPTTASDTNVKPRISLRCNSSTGRGGPSPPGENENRTVLDAFFLGKALAEALNERIESTVGEFLSTIGRLQAEQQKQVQDFQEEVFERAKKSKEKAAREAMEAQGFISRSSASDISTVTPTTVSSNASDAPAFSAAQPNSSAQTSDEDQKPTSTGPPLEVPIDD